MAKWIAAFVLIAAAARISAAPPRTAPAPTLGKDARREFIRHAQVWSPTDVARMNLRQGPPGPHAFAPNALVECAYAEHPMSGSTRKFYCAVPGGDVVKVRYGEDNGEVEASALATRLLWALGFPADRVYPVRVRCRGCSADPWNNRGVHAGEVHDFDPAVIERPPAGHEIHADRKKDGWEWPELDDVDADAGGATLAQRDALKLLAVFMQHSDTKPEQQRLLCAPGALMAGGVCSTPFLVLHDVGVTFGRANLFNRGRQGSANLDEWQRTPIWKDRHGCVGHLSKSNTGTLEDPRISEAGRRFLADLLIKLSDSQIRDLFDVARVELRSGTVDRWVAAFKSKRADIVTRKCDAR